MDAFKTVTSCAVPFNRANVDTDMIIPGEYLKWLSRTGLGVGAFKALRFLEDGTTPNPESEFNDPRYRGAQILLCGDNFGCGSSREHAAWGIKDLGFKVLIAPSFADIFYSNCFKNGLVTVTLPEDQVQMLMEDVKDGAQISVDLEAQTVQRPNQDLLHFEYEPFKRHALLNGLDEIGITMQKGAALDSFEAKQRSNQPWLYGPA
ncbi:MAG: 3-isopropylmalate dehydratase small subunit [Pseudomonadota bacterium]